MTDTVTSPVELVSAFHSAGYDPLDAGNLLHDEVHQRRETGY